MGTDKRMDISGFEFRDLSSDTASVGLILHHPSGRADELRRPSYNVRHSSGRHTPETREVLRGPVEPDPVNAGVGKEVAKPVP
jgi:hypothetical protein